MSNSPGVSSGGLAASNEAEHPGPSRVRQPTRMSRRRLGRPKPSAWRRWTRDVAIIAAGARAALAGQAWWQYQQDRERERDYLRHLLADTRENARRIDRLIADDSSSQEAVRRVATFVYDTSAPPPRDTLVAWFLDGGVFSSSAFYPLTSTYATLLATGDLRLVRDEPLRSELVAYAARMDAEREAMGRYIPQVFGDGSRIVHTFPFMRLLFSGDTARLRTDARAFAFLRLRRDPDAVQFLFALQNAKSNRLNHLRTLRIETGRLRSRLEGLGVEAAGAR
jgi:hypothetical protein